MLWFVFLTAGLGAYPICISAPLQKPALAEPQKRDDSFHKNVTLKGVHLQLDCAQCHRDNRPLKGMSDNCRYCHHHEDPHQGALNPCSRCHTQTFWTMTQFHHATTRFPLLGAHAMTSCQSCHRQGIYQGLPQDCRSCHAKDAWRVSRPNHNNARFQDCQHCHNPFTFDLPPRSGQ
jgi:hypothetical protein